jgi:hypothetical protein
LTSCEISGAHWDLSPMTWIVWSNCGLAGRCCNKQTERRTLSAHKSEAERSEEPVSGHLTEALSPVDVAHST